MVPARIPHKTECDHAQTPYARRKCRKTKLAKENTMIETVTVENRTRNWRGEEKITTTEYTQITGTITTTSTDNTAIPAAGRTSIYTVQAGDTTVTVAHIGGLATDMRPLRAGDTVRILASTDCTIAQYLAETIDRI